MVIGRNLDSDGNALFSDTDTIEVELLICIARGTLVDTLRGAVPAETVQIGDDVRLQDGRIEPLAWVGTRRLTRDDLVASTDLRPIRIEKGALGPDAPDRDFFVSPQHRVLVTGRQAEPLFGEREVLGPPAASSTNV